MKRTLLALALCAVAADAATTKHRVGDFALIDSQGDFYRMSYFDNHKAIALLVVVDANAEALKNFGELAKKYEGQVKFFLLSPSGTASRDSLKQLGTTLPVLIDDTQVVSHALGVKNTGEAFLLDSKSFTVAYRGPANASLTIAVNGLLAGKSIVESRVAVKGDPIKFSKELSARNLVSYSKDIAPILAENCARCHREGGIGPFAMNSHNAVQGFAPMIREVLMTKRMPPGQVDPHVGHIKSTYALSPTQTQQLVRWIDAGAKRDGDLDPLTQLRWPQSKWSLGEPDLVVKVPAQDIPATGVLALRDVNVPIEGIDRDRYVRASEYLPSDRKVLHHTFSRVVAPSGGMANGLDVARIVSYVPGTPPLIEPDNTGGLLRKGSSLALNMHYTTMGKATIDAGEIGIWFYPDGQAPKERMSVACGCIGPPGWKSIPPNASHHEMQRILALPNEFLLYSFAPHMHFRGKRMRLHAEYPDGQREELLNIANYQYAWQMTYELAEPKRMPAGTKLIVTAAFDNSAQNKANPDPSRSVPYGEQSWDEMMFGIITLKYIDRATN